jgi:putative ABC transport system permease protein
MQRQILRFVHVRKSDGGINGLWWAIDPDASRVASRIRDVAEGYSMNVVRFCDSVWRDLCYAIRVYRRSPGFTLVAILSLTVGIGANTAIFSVVYNLLLRPLPYPSPEQLMRVGQRTTHESISLPEFQFWKQHASTFASACGYRPPEDRGFASGTIHKWIKAMPITQDFFRTLSVPLILGREFNASEVEFNGPAAILLSEGLARQAFGAKLDALGRLVTLDGTSYAVVGVVSQDFWFPEAAEAFIPIQSAPGAVDQGENTEMIARLRKGVTSQQSETEMATITEDFRRGGGGGAATLPSDYAGLSIVGYHEWLNGDVRLKSLTLFGAVGLLLLIACSNLVSLLLARLTTRKRSIAVRLALGSSLGRLLQESLIENILLVVIGGAGGLVAAQWLLDALMSVQPSNFSRMSKMQLDGPILAFNFAVALGIGLILALVVFSTSSQLNINAVLENGSQPNARHRMRSALIIGEIALSVSLLVTATLFIRTLYLLHQEQLGFTPQGVITFWMPPHPDLPGKNGGLRNFDLTLLARLQTLPGVRSVAAVNVLPLTDQNNFPAEREGHPDQSIGGMEIRIVTPEYFSTMGIPVRRGRYLRTEDSRTGAPVIVVSETLAHRWWPSGDMLGDRIVVGRYKGQDLGDIKDPPREVVGVVGDTKSVYLREPPRPTVYIPMAQAVWMTGGMAWAVKAKLSPGFGDVLRQEISSIDPGSQVERLRTMESIVAETTADSRFNASLFGFFAGLALLLTGVGVYGLLSFMVATGSRDIGLRMALGATRQNVLRLVVMRGLRLIVPGLVLGLAGAFIMARVLSGLLFGIAPSDPVSFWAATALILSTGFLASLIPAQRAARLDPVAALRYE